MGGWFDSDEVEVDIKVTHDPDNTSDLNVDVALVYFVKVENGERVKASIATAVASISGASSEKIEVAQKFLLKIIEASLNGLQVPGGEEGR